MPYPNEHSARVLDPSGFEPNSFRRKQIAPGVAVILGRLRGQTAMTVQAYRFDKTRFTAEQAKQWLKEHNVGTQEFVEASEKAEGESYPWDECIADQMERYGDEETAARVCGWIRQHYGKSDKSRAEMVAEAEKALEIEPPKPQATNGAKHHVDPHIGGRPAPEEIKAEDYVIPDERRFPIVLPIDIHDAVHAWGSYRGAWTYEQFKARLIAIAQRKGPQFVAALPASWRKELEEREGKSDWTVKAAGDWELDVLGVPFGDSEHKDAQGEYFTPETEYHEDKYALPPVVYYHGLDDRGLPAGEPQYIGKAIKRWVDKRGVWFRVVLEKGNELARKVWEAAKRGLARASSGSIAHLTRKGEDGRILEWPVAELSLFELDGNKRPANPYAVAVPALRAVYKTAGLELPSELNAPEAEPGAGPDGSAATAESVKSEQTQQGESKMDANELKSIVSETMKAELAPLAQKLADVSAEVEKIKAEPPKAEGVVVTADPADRPFESIAEQCKAIKVAAVGGAVDPRLLRLKDLSGAMKQTGANEGVPAAGGFLLEPTLVNEFLKPIHEEGPFTKLVRRMPVGTNSNYGWINGVDETSRADGSRWGGIRGYRLGEGDVKTPSRPTFRRINWELKKYAVLVYATDELLQDASMFEAIVRQAAAEELAFMANFDILRGNGAAGPLGILSSGALVTVAAEAGQVTDTVVQENIEHMWQALLPASRPKAAWFINSEVEPQLDMLVIAGGTGVLEPRFVTYGPDGILRIKGRPVYVTEFNSALGDLGDIVLADMSEYLFWEKGGVQSASSIHVNFLYDETVFRFVYRCDGQPTMASPVTPLYAAAGVTQSAFVTLAAR